MASEPQHRESCPGSYEEPFLGSRFDAPCVWSMSWSVLLPLREAATAADRFVCVTSPSSPLLPMRIGALTFEGFTCLDSASESAHWSFFDSWPAACEYSASELHRHFGSCRESRPGFPPACVWSMSWSVLLPLAERAAARDAFVCVTLPPSPLLPIRIGTFTFDAPYWLESASDFAFCSFFDSWPAACEYEASEQHEPSFEPPPDCV